MRIDLIGPELTTEEINQKTNEIMNSFSELFLAPVKNYTIRGLLPTGHKTNDQEAIKTWKEYKYIGLSDITIFASQNIASVNNSFKIYDSLTEELIKKQHKKLDLQREKQMSVSIFDRTPFNPVVKLKNEMESGLNKFYDVLEEKQNKKREEIKEKLSMLGYDLAEVNHQRGLFSVTMSNVQDSIDELTALWSTMKKKSSLLEPELNKLINNIFHDKKFEELNLVSYNPASEYDKENFPPEIAYSKYNYVMAINKNNLVGKTLEILRNEDWTKAVAVSSKLGEKNYVQIDFKTDNLPEVKETLNKLELKNGNIFHSGNSYHYYDVDTAMNKENWINFMEKLKSYETIGSFWPKLQQEQGFSMLRITPSFEKHYIPEKVN